MPAQSIIMAQVIILPPQKIFQLRLDIKVLAPKFKAHRNFLLSVVKTGVVDIGNTAQQIIVYLGSCGKIKYPKRPVRSD